MSNQPFYCYRAVTYTNPLRFSINILKNPRPSEGGEMRDTSETTCRWTMSGLKLTIQIDRKRSIKFNDIAWTRVFYTLLCYLSDMSGIVGGLGVDAHGRTGKGEREEPHRDEDIERLIAHGRSVSEMVGAQPCLLSALCAGGFSWSMLYETINNSEDNKYWLN